MRYARWLSLFLLPLANLSLRPESDSRLKVIGSAQNSWSKTEGNITESASLLVL